MLPWRKLGLQLRLQNRREDENNRIFMVVCEILNKIGFYILIVIAPPPPEKYLGYKKDFSDPATVESGQLLKRVEAI